MRGQSKQESGRPVAIESLTVQALETVVASTTAMPRPSSSPTASTSRRANTTVTSSSGRAVALRDRSQNDRVR